MSVLLEKSPIRPSVARAPSPQGEILLRVLAILDREEVPYCLLHGYEKYPQQIDGDVDCLIPEAFVKTRLAGLLHENREEIGARVVQWFADGAVFIVLAGRDSDGAPVLLQLHVSARFEMAGRIFFSADEILSGRRRFNGFWVPATSVEFACILANRLAKEKFAPHHGERLSTLFMSAPTLCEKQIFRLLGPEEVTIVTDAAHTGDWSDVEAAIPRLRALALNSSASLPMKERLCRVAAKVRRWLRPRNGFHAVFLGPDGVGKSTTIEAFQRDLKPAFLSSIYLTFAPGLLPQKFKAPKPDGPHSLPPRSLPASLLKAAWWAVCYTIGYVASIRPTLARGGLVVNHRYLVDAIVDRKRYRYRGPVWLLKLIWVIAPKPDVVFLLDAPADVIQRRKQEVTAEETAQQVQAYRAVIGRLPIGKVIDATQPRERVAMQVEWMVLDRLADRCARNLSFGGSI